ncbi:MAG: glutaminyl-peptide cyclotransferase [Flavobacterium sp.]|nr:glutaminyl-peptide cyclotransferase [Candidatus Neoflavobacterium equi]
MNKYNILTFSILAGLLIGCKGNEKNEENNFSFDSKNLKQVYLPNESIEIKLLNPDNSAFDSIVYLNNDQRIQSAKDLSAVPYSFLNNKLGYQNFKALIYDHGKANEVNMRVELVTDVQPEIKTFTILNTYPHDQKAYTQGLEFYGEIMIESTGNGEGVGTGTKGKSSIRHVNYKTGEVLKKVELTDDVFGEGATVLNDKIYQLTWLNLEGYVYDVKTLERLKTFPYFKKIQGWGLTNDGTNLLMSDGTEKIYFMNPETFKEVDYINVYTNSSKIPAINEMEYVDGKVYANIYTTDSVAIINPKTGAVEGVIDFSSLKSKVSQHPDLDVLNGIAYNKKTGTFFITGKNWDKMFEVKIN